MASGRQEPLLCFGVKNDLVGTVVGESQLRAKGGQLGGAGEGKPRPAWRQASGGGQLPALHSACCSAALPQACETLQSARERARCVLELGVSVNTPPGPESEKCGCYCETDSASATSLSLVRGHFKCRKVEQGKCS